MLSIKKIMLPLAVIACSTLGCSNADQKCSTAKEDPAYPEFSWDKVPVCIHLSKDTGDQDFTEQDLEFMARFPIVCIEKSQAHRVHNGMENGTLVAAKGIKKYNPKTKVLFYLNSRIDYGARYTTGAILSDEQHPDWALKDTEGNYIEASGCRTFDTSLSPFRDWWHNLIMKNVSQPEIDGVFVDAILHYRSLVRRLSPEKHAQVDAGLNSMLERLSKELPEDKLLVGNHTQGNVDNPDNNGMKYFKYTDASMLEHFAGFSASEPKELVEQEIQMISKIGKMGKIAIVKGWPRYLWIRSEEYKDLSQEQLEEVLKEDITYPLACFLIAAQENAYFCYSLGYMGNHGGLVDYPEYNKPLGEPLGDYVKEGWVFTRKFEHADVWVDLENRKAKIDWK